MLIRVYGKGCPRCHALVRNLNKAIEDLGLQDATVEHITDVQEIAKLGPVLTPVLEIDGQIISTGQVLSPRKARQLLSELTGSAQ